MRVSVDLCELPAAREPCGQGYSRAAPAADGCKQSAGQGGKMPVETEGWALGSWRGVCGPELSTSAVETDWPSGEPGLLLLLLQHTHTHRNTQ